MRRLLAVLFLVPLLFSAAPSAANLETSPYLTRVFESGEEIVYALSWLGVVGGTATMTVVPSADTIRFTSLAQSEGFLGRLYPVRDEIESVVDRDSFATLRFAKELDERGRSKNEVTLLDLEKGVAHHEGAEIPVEIPIYDPLSSIYYLRTLDLTPGKTHMLSLIADGKVYQLEVNVLRRETLRVDGSTFDTVLVEPKMRRGGIFRDENRRLLIWYTADQRRVPVRIRSELEFGNITATIRTSRLSPGETASGSRSAKSQ